MSLCESVSKLAAEVEPQLKSPKDSHIRMLAALKRLPIFLERNDLSQFEAEYRSAIDELEDESNPNYQIVEALYEIVCVNLFGEFNEEETRRVYDWALKYLAARGVQITGGLNVTNW